MKTVRTPVYLRYTEFFACPDALKFDDHKRNELLRDMRLSMRAQRNQLAQLRHEIDFAALPLLSQNIQPIFALVDEQLAECNYIYKQYLAVFN